MDKIIKLYRTKQGKIPFLEWFDCIKNEIFRARIKRRIDRLALGLFGDYKRIDNNLFELRLHFGSGFRIYFLKHKANIIILLLGGDKGSQKKDIQKARKYSEDFKKREQL